LQHAVQECRSAEDGVMTNSHGCADIITEQKFRDLKLSLEFKIVERSNGGVYMRGSPFARRVKYQIKYAGPLRLPGDSTQNTIVQTRATYINVKYFSDYRISCHRGGV
jgi:hypothetical protein